MAHTWQHKQEDNISEIWGIITQRSRRNMPTQEMGTLNRVGHEALQGLGTYGEAIDWTNKQVRLGSLLESNVLGRHVSNKIRQSKIGQDILDFSYHDARQGAVKWIGGKNQATGIAANILLPDAMDFIGGVGYADNVVKAVNKYGPDIINRVKRIAPNAQDILKRGGDEANKLLDQATQGIDNLLDPFGGAVRAGAGGPNVAARSVGDFKPNTVFQATTMDRTFPGGRMPGKTINETLRTAVKSGADDNTISKILSTKYATALEPRYLDGRKGFYNIKRLTKDKELLNKVISKHEEIAQYHLKYTLTSNPDNQRRLYEIIGDTYFNNSKLIYGEKSKWIDSVTDVSNWLKGDQWHHIFGNKEAGEVLMNAIARDPLVGVNVARLLQKNGISAAGIAENLMIMKKMGHANFHDFLRAVGFDPSYGRRGALDVGDFAQEIAKAASQGVTYTAKAGPGLAGKVIPPDPTYVNELFTLVEKYGEVNKYLRKLMDKGEVWVKNKQIVPKGTEGAKIFDFTIDSGRKGPKPKTVASVLDKTARVYHRHK